jgi:GxxExxY protein
MRGGGVGQRGDADITWRKDAEGAKVAKEDGRKEDEMTEMTENELSYQIIGAAIEVHKQLGGPGLLEDMYEEALVFELAEQGLRARRHVGFRVKYKGRELKKRLVFDVLVEDLVIVETKSVETYNSIFEAQLLTYLRQTGKRLGLVINFGETQLKDGIHRVVNKLKESQPPN